MWLKEPLNPKVMIFTFLTPKLLLLVFNRINNNFRYNIRSSNMVLEPFVVAHSRKPPIFAIFGPKISKLKLMRYHIHWGTDLKFCMVVDMALSNTHAKYFFLGQPILKLWDFNSDWSTPKWPKIEIFWHPSPEKVGWSKIFENSL